MIIQSVVLMKSTACTAESTQSLRSKIMPARAIPLIINPFQLVRFSVTAWSNMPFPHAKELIAPIRFVAEQSFH